MILWWIVAAIGQLEELMRAETITWDRRKRWQHHDIVL